MSITSVLHSEWLKIRSARSLGATLGSVFLATVAFSLLMCATLGTEETGKPDFDPLRSSFFGLNFGQVAAICFGALAVAGSTGAVPSVSRWPPSRAEVSSTRPSSPSSEAWRSSWDWPRV